MLTRILATGLAAGVIAGLLVAALLHVTTTPLILKAETYEKAGEKASGHQHSQLIDDDAHLILAHAETPAPGAARSEVWEPADGLERTGYTTLATVGTAVGFALMLLAAMVASGVPITARTGVSWGLAAFFATALAPALGLPPELPGSAAADIVQRQTWWFVTAAATAGGIWLLFRSPKPLHFVLGLALIAAPHVVGAPHAHEYASTVPAEIAGHFTAASLVVHAVLWTVVGALAGHFWERRWLAGPVPAT